MEVLQNKLVLFGSMKIGRGGSQTAATWNEITAAVIVLAITKELLLRFEYLI